MKKSMIMVVLSSSVFLFACSNKYAGLHTAKNQSGEQSSVRTAKAGSFEEFHGEQMEDGSNATKQWTNKKQFIVKDDEVVLFSFDKSGVNSSTKDLLKQYADYLSNHPHYKVRIEGHTDERGSREYNIALGERRAKSLARILMFDGVAQDRISMLSYGKEKPIALNHDETSWTKNRRGTLTIIKDDYEG